MAITCFLPAPTAALRPSFLGRASPLTTTARPATAPRRRAAVRAVADAADSQLAWVDAIELADVQPGRAYRRVLAGLDICVACAESGEVYALANKGPPLGIPLSDGVVVSVDGIAYLRCAQYGTLFELSTGNVKEGTWVRDNGDVLQVLVDVKAREQYEQRYWKGILDASGKADGGYY